jgi:hypothetical protein
MQTRYGRGSTATGHWQSEAALAKVLDRWAQEHPDPYLGPHWPST